MFHECNQFVYVACHMFLVKLILEISALFYFPDLLGFLLQCLSKVTKMSDSALTLHVLHNYHLYFLKWPLKEKNNCVKTVLEEKIYKYSPSQQNSCKLSMKCYSAGTSTILQDAISQFRLGLPCVESRLIASGGGALSSHC